MQSTIPLELRAVLEKADVALRESIHPSIDGLTWSWTLNANTQDGPTLTVSYAGNTDSRNFTIEELQSQRDVVWKARELWENVALANFRRTSDRIVDILLEFEPETPLQKA